MSQFTLTQDEDALVLTALRDSAARYTAMFGVTDPALESVIAKVESQLPQPEIVVESAPVAMPVVETEVAVETPKEAPEEETE